MKKFRTTKRHPLYKRGVIIQENDRSISVIDTLKCIHSNIREYNLEVQVENGTLKEVKEKVWVINKAKNWTLEKRNHNSLSNRIDFEHLIKFKSKKKALNYVLKEAKERFPVGTKINNTGCLDTINELCIDKSLGKHPLIINKRKKIVVWQYNKGWSAEPIKEPEFTKDDLLDFAMKCLVYNEIKNDSKIDEHFESWLKYKK